VRCRSISAKVCGVDSNVGISRAGLMRLFSASGRKYRSVGNPSPTWVKSSLSIHNGNCVEVRGLDAEVIEVRDSKNPRRGTLSFTPAEWDAFVGGVQLGEFNRTRRDR